MSNKLDKRVRQAAMVILMVFVVSVAIKSVHDEFVSRKAAAQVEQEDKAYKEFFAWRGK